MRIHGIQVTNLDRVVYPDAGVTKRELFDYFDAVAQPMLVHLESRLLTLVRHPKGVGGDAFFQKHGGEGTPEVVPRFVVPRKQAEGKEPYVYVDAEPALFALVQIGVLEFHVWNSRVPEIDKPDQIVFDLDPGPRVSFAEVIDGAREVRRRLAAIGLAAFVKTTGGKGLHVVAPIVPEHGWEIIGALARILARGMARDDPDRFTSSVSAPGLSRISSGIAILPMSCSGAAARTSSTRCSEKPISAAIDADVSPTRFGCSPSA